MDAELMKDKCVDVASIMKVIAHPQRLMILCYISEGEKSVNEITNLLNISQSQVSQFLTRMQKERLVQVRREGTFSFYSVADKRILKLMQSMQKIFCV